MRIFCVCFLETSELTQRNIIKLMLIPAFSLFSLLPPTDLLLVLETTLEPL